MTPAEINELEYKFYALRERRDDLSDMHSSLYAMRSGLLDKLRQVELHMADIDREREQNIAESIATHLKAQAAVNEGKGIE